ncbi:HD-GYP domain-containing protein [Peribacillus frigoritolerans]|uniref:HD-GYP domain-containing protein n=1 Tax=Peribacillus castrilensis TaxID=2897690 RepID=UPI003DA49E4F
MKGKSRLPRELAGYLKLGDAVIITDQDHIILHHHEKWDGTGYPYRLKGEEIPLEARIVAIVGVFDALTSKRPYKDSWSVERALSFINEQKGKHFDPSIVLSFFCYFYEKAAQKKGCDTVRIKGI